MGMMEVHALAGCVETGFDSRLGGPCGSLAGVSPELTCLSFRDSWRVSEGSAAETGTGWTENCEGTPLSLLSLSSSETLRGSERDQLTQHAPGLLVAMGAYMMTLGAATQMLAGSADTYVTGLQERSDPRGWCKICLVREFPTYLTERNSLVANAAASEDDNSVKSIVIGFLEESPRANL